MAGLASINVRFSVDLTQFSSEMQNSLRQIDRFGQRMQQVGKGLTTYVTAPILALGIASVKFASDVVESTNKVDVAFGSASESVKQFSDTTLENFGIAKGSSLDMASNFGDMATSMGLPVEAASKMSTSLVGLAGDLASFKNIGIDQAQTALAGIFTGETESLKKLGIIMTEANLQAFAYSSGIKILVRDMDQASKVNLRYNYIIANTKNAQGDFARTAEGAANQTRSFTEGLKQISAQIGAVLLPLYTKMVTFGNSLIKSFSGLSEESKTVIVVVAGLVAAIGPLLLAIGYMSTTVIPLLAVGLASVTTAFTAMSAAMLANPITAIALVIAAAAGAAYLLAKNTDKVTQETIKLSAAQQTTQKVTDQATASIVDQQSKLALLLISARNENAEKKDRLAAIKAINDISPKYLGNLTLENINTDKARISLEKYNKALLSGATARAASALLEKNQSDKIQAGFDREKALADYNDKLKNANNLPYQEYEAVFQKINHQLQLANATLSEKNKFYDDEAKSLIDIYEKNKANLDLVKETAIGMNSVAKSAEKIKAPKNIDGLKSFLELKPSEETAAAYDAQIQKIKQFRDEVATTATMVAAANEAIKKVEFAKALSLDPTSLIKTVETVEQSMTRLKASVAGATTSLAKDMIDISAILSQQFTQLATDLSVGIGSAVGAIASGTASMGDVFKSMLGIIGNFLGSLGKSLITAGIAGIAFKKLLANPYVAIAAGAALIALSAVVANKLEKGPSGTKGYANGGIIGGTSFFGDKILARVNSGEMIANQTQQKNIWGAMSNGGSDVNVSVGGSFEIDGHKLRLVLDRADKRNNRLG